MSDSVERWAVIELLSDRRCNTNCFDESGQKIYEELSKAIKDIQDLPSAPTEIIRCKDCLMHGVCRFEQGLGLDGYCSQGERRTDG